MVGRKSHLVTQGEIADLPSPLQPRVACDDLNADFLVLQHRRERLVLWKQAVERRCIEFTPRFRPRLIDVHLRRIEHVPIVLRNRDGAIAVRPLPFAQAEAAERAARRSAKRQRSAPPFVGQLERIARLAARFGQLAAHLTRE